MKTADCPICTNIVDLEYDPDKNVYTGECEICGEYIEIPAEKI